MSRPEDIRFIRSIDPKNPYVPSLCPIKGLYLVSRLVRGPRHSKTNTPPGHTFQLVTSGNIKFTVNNQFFDANKDDVLYFYESEIEEVWVGEEGLEMINVVFNAPDIIPFPTKVFKSNKTIRNFFHRINKSYNKDTMESGFETYYNLFGLLMALYRARHIDPFKDASPKEVWLQAEAYIRRKNKYNITVSELCYIFKCSQSTITRSCRKITMTSPKKRIKTICMGEARGLLLHSDMKISDIAKYLGYQRIHEFSRDFSNYFEISPSRFRAVRE